MRTFIKNYIDAKKRQKLEETGEEGFSLIELIIVVVILGILVAVAIPILLNIQGVARDNAVKAAAANGAVAAATVLANPTGTVLLAETNAAKAGTTPIVVDMTSTGTDVATVCVIAYDPNAPTYKDAGSAAKSGPGC
jgi:type IV pilus assembly protein PilA